MSDETDLEVKIGSPAPEFRLPASTGGQVGLEDYRDKANLVLFFVREFH